MTFLMLEARFSGKNPNLLPGTCWSILTSALGTEDAGWQPQTLPMNLPEVIFLSEWKLCPAGSTQDSSQVLAQSPHFL